MSENLTETQETLAALSLGSPPHPETSGEVKVPAAAVAAAAPTSHENPAPAVHEFLRSTLERAYDELLRHWISLGVVDWPTTLDGEEQRRTPSDRYF